MATNMSKPPPSSPPSARAPASATAHLPPVKILWATHNEDSRVELALTRILASRKRAEAANLRVLCVAGCGVHALTLCSDSHVQSVDAVDVRSTQLMLAQLTAAAARAVESPSHLAAFLGTGGDVPARRSAYDNLVRPLLSDETAAFWDENVDTIEAGIVQCGGAERFLAEIRARLPSTDPAELRKLPEDAVRAAVRGAYTVENALVNMPGVPAATWDRIFPILIESSTSGFIKALSKLQGETLPNALAYMTCTGEYPMGEEAHRPLFLQPAVFDAVRARGCEPPRLRFHEGLVQEVGQRLTAEGGPFDLIDVTNIFDLLPTLEQGEAITRDLAGCLYPGGALLCRWAGGKPCLLPELFTRVGLDVDPQVNAQLFELESSYAMTDLCVGFKS